MARGYTVVAALVAAVRVEGVTAPAVVAMVGVGTEAATEGGSGAMVAEAMDRAAMAMAAQVAVCWGAVAAAAAAAAAAMVEGLVAAKALAASASAAEEALAGSGEVAQAW